jgi:hypothetical protein
MLFSRVMATPFDTAVFVCCKGHHHGGEDESEHGTPSWSLHHTGAGVGQLGGQAGSAFQQGR